MVGSHRALTWSVRALVVAGVAQVALPMGEQARAWSYVAVALAASVVAVAGGAVNRPLRRRGWALVVAGFAGWALADLLWTIEQYQLAVTTYPVPSDVLYLASYPV